jgi:hypothetical protein
MATLIRDLPRFQKDCEIYEEVIRKVSDHDKKLFTKLNSMYADFLLKVESVDRSVEDMATGMVAVGLQHGTFVEELKKIRLDLDREIKKARNVLDKKQLRG